MKKLIWLDDDSISISYDKDVLLPKYFSDSSYKIEFFEKITEFMAFIYQHNKEIIDKDIFIIDIMLIDEDKIILPNSTSINIPDKLMAGVTLYTEYLKDAYPNNPTILYTSREHNDEVFYNIINDPRYGKTLFLIDKWKKDTAFIEILKKLIKDVP